MSWKEIFDYWCNNAPPISGTFKRPIPCFGILFSKYALSSVLGPQGIVVVQEVVVWMVRSRQTKTNSRLLKKAIRRTHIPAEFLRADVDFVCDVGPVRLVEFRSAINSEQQM
ncbi:hypothetical protein AVEN_141431-1 [Araneus ventricosus]|uniref:Uncharacterized protein n=1 Tax=Araneus ventricosus TaxID=182803 RepID=A0A4Y2WCD7_ARAVE|nr:hypothetical protein AVEN_141431-1 [Araneus ventricosus]